MKREKMVLCKTSVSVECAKKIAYLAKRMRMTESAVIRFLIHQVLIREDWDKGWKRERLRKGR